jgi:Bacterial Ig-like domain (group 3)
VTQGTLSATNYGFVFVNGVLTVTAGISLTPPATPPVAGTPVTLTATVPAGATGTVTFYDGTTVLGVVPIPTSTPLAGVTVVTLTVTPTTPGTHTITAAYSGDANFPPSTSAPLAITVAAGADFSMTSSTGSQLIPPGASATYTITVSSVNSAFTNPITMSASNLPPGASYTFNPTVVTPGAAGANTTLTVSVPQQSAALHTGRLMPAALALLLLPFAWLRRSRGSPYRLLLWMLLALGSLGAVSGCGTGGYFSQPQQTYTITVTGTSGTLVHSTTVTLTVE